MSEIDAIRNAILQGAPAEDIAALTLPARLRSEQKLHSRARLSCGALAHWAPRDRDTRLIS